MSTVEQQVKAIVAEQLGVKQEQVTNDASFVDDLGADSLDTVELVMALEEEFEIEIPDEDADARGFLLREGQRRIVDGKLRGRDRVLDEDVHLLDVFLLDEAQRVESLDLARDLG